MICGFCVEIFKLFKFQIVAKFYEIIFFDEYAKHVIFKNRLKKLPNVINCHYSKNYK